IGHFGESGALASQHILHRRRSIGAALPERVDQRLVLEGVCHPAAPIIGADQRRSRASSGSGVGYSPEKQAWHQPSAWLVAATISSSVKYSSESTPRYWAISTRECVAAISSDRVGVSMPYRHGPVIGGEAIRRWTLRAPAPRISCTRPLLVVPRTSESSMTTTLRPSITSRTGLNL